MGRRILLYFALFSTLLFVPSFSATIFFNQTIAGECQRDLGGCAFDNSSIWENNTIPTYEDFVFINGNTTSDLLIYTTNTTGFAALHIWSVSFFVTSTLSVGEIHQDDNSFLIVQIGMLTILPNNTYHLSANASLILNVDTYFNVPLGEFFGRLEIQSGAHLVANVSIYAPVSVDIQQSITLAYLNIPPFTKVGIPAGLLSNVVTVGDGAQVNVAGGLFGAQITVIGNSSISIADGASLLERNNLPPVYGTGFVEITSGEATILSFQNLAFNGTLSFGAVDQAYISNLTVQTLQVAVGSNENPPHITGDGLVFGGPSTIFGNLIAEGFGITIDSSLAFDGNLTVNRSTLAVVGTLSLSSASLVQLEFSEVLLGGTIIAEGFGVPPNSTFRVNSARGVIIGNVYNHGTIDVGTTNQLAIEDGNFTQHHTGVLSVGVATGSIAPVTVNGTVELSGNIQYTLAKKPVLKSTEKYLVISASAKVNGTFETSASPNTDSSIQRNLSLQYNDKDVYILYSFHADDVDIWMWAVLGVVIAVVIVVIVAIVVKLRRRRTAYQKI